MKTTLRTKAISSLPRRMAYVAAAIIALMPFHAFLSVFASSLVGVENYTAIRLWKEVLLAGLLACLIYMAAARSATLKPLVRDRLVQLIGAYVLLLLMIGMVAFWAGGVSAKALAYGLLLDARFLVFFVITWAVTLHTDLLVRLWKRLLLIPAAIAVGFAALQYSVLPADWLRHFGYGPDTIAPTATIDQKEAYQRVQSTLRGANPFGAYLVLVLSAVGARLLKTAQDDRKTLLKWAGLYVLSLLALFFTFSRSAWIGAAASSGLLVWLSLRSSRTRRTLVIAGCAGLLAFAAVGYALRDNDHFQNVFFHTNEHSRSAESSNSGHFRAMADGLDDIARAPLGSGTGTAGPASVYNGVSEPRIAENYYIQIGQEAGVIGMALFALINVLVGFRLWERRQNQLALVLLVSFAGISLINLLMHAWTDDTLAYVWWGLAGAAMVLPGAVQTRSKSGNKDAAVS